MEGKHLVGGHDLRRRGIRLESASPGSPRSSRSNRTRSISSSDDEPDSFNNQSDTSYGSSYSRSTISNSFSDRDAACQSFTSLDSSHNASRSSHTAFSPTKSSPSKQRVSPKRNPGNLIQGMKTQTLQNPEHLFNWIAVLIIASLIFIFGIYILFFWPRNMSVQPTGKDFFGELKKSLGILKQEFPSQSDRFWKVIGTAVKQVVVNDEPRHPAVILITAPESNSASRTSSCLAYRFLQNINQIYDLYDSPYIDSKLLDHSSHSQEKLDLDDSLKRKLENGSMGVVIDHIESLSPAASLLFHGYCDGDNAPFKKATIALVYHTNIPSDALTEKVVEQTLTNMWENDLDEDKIPALLSRIANNVAMTSEETVEQLSKVCPDFV